MDLVQELQQIVQKIRDAAADGRFTIRELLGIAAEIGDVLRIVAQILSGMAQQAAKTGSPE